MTGKRSAAETQSLRSAAKEGRKDRDTAQQRAAQANFLAGKLTLGQVKDIRDRRERGEEYRTIGKAYGLDEFTAARVVRYGKLSPWQHAEAARNARRVPLQEAWKKRNEKDQLSAS